MKKSILYLLNQKMLSPILLATFFLLFATACSLDSDSESIDLQQIGVEKSFHLEMSKTLQNPEFKTALNKAFSNTNAKIQGAGNGIMIISNPGGIGWFIPYDSDGDGSWDRFVEFGYGQDEGSIKLLPNGQAQFFAKTTNASASILDWGWNTLYSNVCEETGGTLLAKITGEYVQVDFTEYGGGIVYFITKAQTADVWSLKPTFVTDALQGYDVDEYWNFTPICGEAMDSKTLSINLTGIFNNKNPNIKFNVKLD